MGLPALFRQRIRLKEFEHKLARDRAEFLKIAVPCAIDQFKFGPVNPAREQRAVGAGVDLSLAALDDQGRGGDIGQRLPARRAWSISPRSTGNSPGAR